MSVLKPWDPAPDIAFSYKKKARKPKHLVSICVTNFNYAALIGDCLDSIADQTYPHLELVVVDDCSTKDRSVQVITEWMAAHTVRFYSLKCLVNRRNQGPSFARNMAFEHALSDVVFIIDADNMVYPTALEKLHTALIEGEFPAIYSQLEEFGDRQGVGSADIWDARRMRRNNYVDVMALIRKSAWRAVGGFSHIEKGWEDYDFWLKFVDRGLVPGYLPEILCRYRVHGLSRTATDALAAHYDLELVMEFRHPGQDGAEGDGL